MADIKLKGRVKLECYDKDGNEKWNTGWIDNIICNSGIAAVSGLVGNVGSETAFTVLAVGSGSAAVAATDTDLQTEITANGLGAAAGTVTQETSAVTDDQLQVTYTWSVTGTQTIEEIGLKNNVTPTSGELLGHALTTTKSVVNGDQFIGTYQITFS